MKPIRSFSVIPSLPPRIEALREIAYNIRWAWNHGAIELFRRLDRDLWETAYHNPVLMLGTIAEEKLDHAAGDDAFLAHLDRVAAEFDRYRESGGWFSKHYGQRDGRPLVAYFSAEFGLTESMSIFAGGLGILAGDHLKSASDLGIPLVAVGLLYQQGYFRQYLNQAGWQQEDYADNDFHNLPLSQAIGPDGKPVVVSLAFPGRTVYAQVWRVQVGRIALYLLDTNMAANTHPEDRDITDQLYGGDKDMRIRQEILLGIGGYRALEALGLEPTVYHMNEGHAAFVALEHARRLMQTRRLSFNEARELAAAAHVFTTHTPVEAGHDYFPPDLMGRYFGEYVKGLGIGWEEFIALGRRTPHDQGDFCMTVLALRISSFRNGVSKLHGQVSRKMWNAIWPGVPTEEVPIGHITNGVHFKSWTSVEMNELYDRYLGPNWRNEPASSELWQRAYQIPAEELWRTHERRRDRLVAWARRRVRDQRIARGAPRLEIEAANEILDPDALTIGFGRRFATYKRATLLMHDLDRLRRILLDPARPVQIIFAGKAHPADAAGKELIRQVASLARAPEFGRRLVFLENYDMAVARYLVEGVDVWLNTPRRPQEASGTSGMKAAANGALNLSTLDGWWDEVWRQPGRPEGIGWAIGKGEDYDDAAYQDQVEAEALYELLERDVVPCFYERGHDRLPRRWIGRMKDSIATLCPFVNTHRMVSDYTNRFYLNAHDRFRALEADGAARTRALAAWLVRVGRAWPQVRIELVEDGPGAAVPVGAHVRVLAHVRLGDLTPEDVRVQLYMGRLDRLGEIDSACKADMKPAGRDPQGLWVFEASEVTCGTSGLHGYTVRVLPHHPDLQTGTSEAIFLPGLIAWPPAEVPVTEAKAR
ncbi:MAG TPA: alpha-glucan family phosphorylase [Bryobacteraceae bacterium]|nr:alpha-glucan family phosphorylase [Bryobacteraceae bacterium]